MKFYESLTVNTLMVILTAMPEDAPICDLSTEMDSYRGYYRHVAIEPGSGTTAGGLLAALKHRLGSTMHGYKGGDYTFGGDCYVFVAYYGETGPSLAGFTEAGEPIVFEQGWFA